LDNRGGSIAHAFARPLAIGMAFCGICEVANAAGTDVFGTLLGQGGAGAEYVVPYAEIQLCTPGAANCAAAVTDSAGTFQFQSLTPGSYIMKVPLKDGTISSDQIYVPDASTQWFKIITK
jgi:hypothetical protein